MRRFLRLPEVIDVTGYRRSRIYELVGAGLFPKPVGLGGGRAVAWLSDEVEAWQQARIEASRPEKDAAQ